MTINVLSDVGGVTFTFDKNARKKIWIEKSADLVRNVLTGQNVTDTFPGLDRNPYAGYFSLSEGFNDEFRAYAAQIAEEVGKEPRTSDFSQLAGQEVLKGMLINPTATALLEYIQGESLQNGELTAEAVPGIRSLVDYVRSSGGIFKGYSTGAQQMPDQFHRAVGLPDLVGEVRTTFPGHRAKERSAEQILEEAQGLYDRQHSTFQAFIDDSDNEAAIWMEARNVMGKQGLGNPNVYLLKRDLSVEQIGVTETSKGEVVVVNSLAQVERTLRGDSSLFGYRSDYQVDFSVSDNKFGGK